ncbi:hypothetical protein FBU30_010307 [Linnemannia zychae]|nr:hypothetical protein FBU30_010307 [Linnemannia zychae]
MTVFAKLALLATFALSAMVSAAPVEPVPHTTAIPSPKPTNSTDELIISAQGGFSGRGTWFTGTLGSCGVNFQSSDMIVAMNAAQMGGTAMCGKMVRVNYGGKSVVARVTDTCPAESCPSGSLDLSPAVFEQLAPLDVGNIPITWQFA